MRFRPGLLLGLVVGPVLLLFIVLTGEAQQTGKVARLEFLSHSFGIGSNEEALRQGLRELGHIEGQNLVIEFFGIRGCGRIRSLNRS